MRKIRTLLAIFFITLATNLFFISEARAEDVVTTIVTPGGDDVSYHIPLDVSLVYNGVTYQDVYATTNSVITFGRPDGTYWDYPMTPSISIESKDWWVLPQQMPDTHFIINVSSGGFQIDGTYRQYGMFTGDTTSIVVTAQIQTDGEVNYSYVVNGPLNGSERTGARLADGTIVTLEEAGVTQVEEAPVLEPTPVEPEPEPLPEPEPQPIQPETPPPAPQPQPHYEPIVEPIPEEPIIPEPEPEVIPEPVPEEEVVPLEPPIVEEPEVAPIEEPTLIEEESQVVLDNGVVLSQEQAVAVALLQNPGELLQAVFTDPGAALAALGQVGADMTPEVREQSEKVVIAAVIAGNIATTAATSAAGAATYRRKP